MLHRSIPIGFHRLLLCHTMACVLVGVGNWWQAEDDLSEQLLVYRPVDSLVEFQFPLRIAVVVITLSIFSISPNRHTCFYRH